MATEGLAPYFQIELHKAGPMDAMRVMVEAEPNSAGTANRASAEQALVKRVKDLVGVSCEVVVSEPGGVPRSQGKAVRVVDNRPKE